jgi:hypothetical protein
MHGAKVKNDCISVAKIQNKSNNVLKRKGFSQENIH